MLEGWGGPYNEGQKYGALNPPSRMHNQGHVWTGGTMLAMSSPNDPAFFYHHANVDRLYQRWLENSGQIYANEENGGKPAPADYPAKLIPLTNAACKAKYPESAAWSKCSLGSAPARLLCLPTKALLVAMGGSALPGREAAALWAPSH